MDGYESGPLQSGAKVVRVERFQKVKTAWPPATKLADRREVLLIDSYKYV